MTTSPFAATRFLLPLAAGLGACADTDDSGAVPTEDTDRYVLASVTNSGDGSSELLFADRENAGATAWSYESGEWPLLIEGNPHPSRSDRLFAFFNDNGRGAEASRVDEMDASGEILASRPATGGHHSFAVFEDGGERVIAYLAGVETEHPDYDAMISDSVIEIDEEGGETEVLNTLDVLTTEEPAEGWETGFYGPDVIDFTHANKIAWNADRGTYLMSLAARNAVWEFTRDGRVVAVYLGRNADSAIYERGAAYRENPYPIYTGGDFAWQHGPAFDADGDLWLLSNYHYTDLDEESRVFEYRIAEDSGTLEPLGEFSPPEAGGHALFLGGVAMAGQNIIVSWGALGVLEEIDPETGETLWSLERDPGLAFAHATVVRDAAGFVHAPHPL